MEHEDGIEDSRQGGTFPNSKRQKQEISDIPSAETETSPVPSAPAAAHATLAIASACEPAQASRCEGCEPSHMPHAVLYHVCKHLNSGRGCKLLASLLSCCKAWRATVQSAVEQLVMGDISQVSSQRLGLEVPAGEYHTTATERL